MANDMEQELLKLGEDWAAAMVTNDADRIGSFMADDWVIVSERGIAAKEDFLAFVRSGQLTHSMFEMRSRARIKLYADTAVLSARIVNTTHFSGQQFDADEWTTDVFVRRDGKWLCILSHITPAQKDFKPGENK
ncbi:MAG TPA: nuclear transport factor 2 family protein [Pyrinomonadaceae bacterium]|nr:nuclear transport factor 2 family protein [Pyrinomonadaceae bacterium]